MIRSSMRRKKWNKCAHTHLLEVVGSAGSSTNLSVDHLLSDPATKGNGELPLKVLRVGVSVCEFVCERLRVLELACTCARARVSTMNQIQQWVCVCV